MRYKYKHSISRGLRLSFSAIKELGHAQTSLPLHGFKDVSKITVSHQHHFCSCSWLGLELFDCPFITLTVTYHMTLQTIHGPYVVNFLVQLVTKPVSAVSLPSASFSRLTFSQFDRSIPDSTYVSFKMLPS